MSQGRCSFFWEKCIFFAIIPLKLVVVLNAMPRSKSSKQWLQAHFDDVYVKRAMNEGYRSRALYKLKAIDEKEDLFKPGMTVVDLGAAPGGWSQYVAERLGGRGTIVAVDLLPMDPLPGVVHLTGDFETEALLEKLLLLVSEGRVDVVLSDMAPNMSGNVAIDIPKAMALSELALAFARRMLAPGGVLLMKVFHGAGFDELVKAVKTEFKRVVIRKPAASRSRSRETYLLAQGIKL